MKTKFEGIKHEEQNKFMFDTNIFDAILNEKIDINTFPKNYEFFVTHIQKDEIEAIDKPDKQERKKRLLEFFKDLKQEKVATESFVLGTSRLGSAKLSKVPTESAVWGVSKWGESKWTSRDNLIEELRKGNLKHTEDALIGETAIKNNFILVTDDKTFLNKVRSLGGRAIRFEQFMKGDFE